MNTQTPRHPSSHLYLCKLLVLAAILVIAITVGGCSLFGVATKSELAAVDQATIDRRNQVVRQVEALRLQLDEVEAEVSTLEQSLAPRMTALEDSVAGSRQEVRRLGTVVEGVRLDTARFNQDMQSAVTAAEDAGERSQETWEAYFASLLEERTRLQLRLDALTEKIERLQTQEVGRRDNGEPVSLEMGIQPEVPESPAEAGGVQNLP